MGQYLAEKLQDAYYPIAFLSYQGYGRAWDRAGQVGVIPTNCCRHRPTTSNRWS